MKEREIELIEIESIREYMDKVKALDNKWAKKMYELMKKEDKSIESVRVVRSIANNLRRNQADRRLFINCAIQLLEKLQKEQAAVVNKMNAA